MVNESVNRLWETLSRDNPAIPEKYNGVWKLGDSEEYIKWTNTLILSGLKTVFSYPMELWARKNETRPESGNYYVLLDSQESAVAIIQLLDVQTCLFEEVPESFAYKAGEGDRSLDTWKENHKPYFKRILEENELEFSTKIELLCVEFELIFAA